IREYFGERLQEQELTVEQTREQSIHADYHQLLIQPTKEGRLRLIFRYDKSLIAFIKQLPYPVYDHLNKLWSVAVAETVRADIEKFVHDHGWQLQYLQQNRTTPGLPRPSAADLPNYRFAPAEFVDLLHTRRYSANTIRTYT